MGGILLWSLVQLFEQECLAAVAAAGEAALRGGDVEVR